MLASEIELKSVSVWLREHCRTTLLTAIDGVKRSSFVYGVRKLPTKADDKQSPFVYETEGPNATGLCSGVAIISEYCKGNSLVVEYPLGLKLIGFYIEDVSFATDQTERHLEVRNISYGNYDSSTKKVYWCHLGYFSVSMIREACLASNQPASPVLPS
ncbi:hypothetical protein Adt_22144 [Abeliophyllum distichum]|uniref:Uncharacterized protein n=1 Tax=Abeliophyllum distichum TaxID=126358 RepID=A0ABD1T1V4_9LAMI